MKKIILAVNNKKIINKIKNNKEIEIIKKVQYREAILEIMENNKNIDEIYIEENLPGIISIEKLIEKINNKNKKINLNIILEKENIDKINKLKKLGIKNIYIKNKIKKEINKNNIKNKIIKKYNINNNKINNNIFIITGNKKSGKSTIINLFIIYLLEKNKNILIININKKIENNYLIIFNKNNIKYKINKFYKKENNKNRKFELFINKNITFNFNPYNKQKIFNEKDYNFKKYDYVIVDVGNSIKIEKIYKTIKNQYKIIYILDALSLGIKALKKTAIKDHKNPNERENSLHIIYNKYYFNSISPLIIRNILKNSQRITTIFYQNKFKNLAKQISKKENIKLNINLKRKIEKVLNN